MSNEIFDDLDFNPLIEVESDEEEKARLGKVTTPITGEPNEDDKKAKVTPIVEDTIEIEEDSSEDAPKNNHLDDAPSQDSNESLKQWFTFYKEKGMIAEDVNEEDLEDFDSLLEAAAAKQLSDTNSFVESYKDSLPKQIKDLVEAWEEGAEEEAFNKIISLKREQVKLDKLDDESIKSNVDLQKTLVKEYMLKTTSLSEEKINKHIERLAGIEELEEEAISASTELKDILSKEENKIKELTKAQAIESAKRLTEQKAAVKEYVSKTKTVIDDIPVTDNERKEIENYIFNPVAKDTNGNPIFYIQKLMMENPTEMAFKLNYLAVATKGFTDWSKITKKAITKATKKVDLTFNPPPKGSKQTPNTNNIDWRDKLRNINK